MSKRLLLSFAHPDDESFGMGGTIARYVSEGVEVSLICATDGDVGTIPDEMQGQFATIRELRLAELECASQKLGFSHVATFGYRDSGMMGSESNDDPNSLWYTWQHDPDRVVKQVVDVIRDLKPQVVVTFNQYGGYGHPDHIAIQQATEKAFTQAGDASYTDSDKLPYHPQKLYYTGLPALALRFMLMVMRLRGQDPRRMGVNKDLDFQAVIDNLEPIHARINVRDYMDAWEEANACHRSQGGGMNSRFPRWLQKLVTGNQGYTRVQPVPNGTGAIERDLFAGISIDS